MIVHVRACHTQLFDMADEDGSGDLELDEVYVKMSSTTAHSNHVST